MSASGIKIPEILIPEEKVNLRKWSVLACDQYTSQPEYWNDVERMVGGMPSTLHIMLPEAYIGESDLQDRISHAKGIMKSFIADGVLVKLPRGVIYVERTMANGKVRHGAMVCIDLEKYDFSPSSGAMIRASEETVLDRVPPRMDMRRDALLECPHAIVLMDDPRNSVLGLLTRKRDTCYKLYDFDLIMNGGHVAGYFVENEDDLRAFESSIAALTSGGGLKLAVGDGNHSLVTAKAIWEEAKASIPAVEQEEHPLRYALVELVNLHDDAVEFLPIHRIVKNVPVTTLLNDVMAALRHHGYEGRLMYSRSTPKGDDAPPYIPFLTRDTIGRIDLMNLKDELTVNVLQIALEEAVGKYEHAQVDYIHDDDAFASMCHDFDTLGFRFGAMNKEDFFPMIEKYGVLPKKMFSIGNADDKRFYFECRLLTDNIESVLPPEPEEDASPRNRRGRKPAAPLVEEEIVEEETITASAPRVHRGKKSLREEFTEEITTDEELFTDEEQLAPEPEAPAKAAKEKPAKKRSRMRAFFESSDDEEEEEETVVIEDDAPAPYDNAPASNPRGRKLRK